MAVPTLALCLAVIDPLGILYLFHAVQQIRSRAQSVPKNDRVNDVATTGATQPRDPDLTSIVFKVQVILLGFSLQVQHCRPGRATVLPCQRGCIRT